MSVNKVVIDGEVKVDLTSDTATAENVLLGETFHGADGQPKVGVLLGNNVLNVTTSEWENYDKDSIERDTIVNILDDELDGQGIADKFDTIDENIDNIEDDIEEIEGNITSLNNAKANNSIVSDAFVSNKNYVVGDCFIYNNQLYRVKANCLNVTPPNENYYDAISVTQQILNTQSTLETHITTNYGIEDIPIVRGGYIENTLGTKRVRVFNADSGSLPSFASSGDNDMLIINHWYACGGDSFAWQIAYNFRGDNIEARRYFNGWQSWTVIL